MKLLVGLGNPGNSYTFTRHNFGFLALDFYCKINNLEWEKRPKFNAVWLRATASASSAKSSSAPSHSNALNTRTSDTIFLKPQGFYNTSGLPVRDFAKFYKIPPEDILVICDDFNLPFGEIRYRKNGSAGGNNGLKSIAAELKTDQFPRLRLGTGNSELRQKLGDTDFVLGKFTPDEKAKLPEILRTVSQRLAEL